MDGSMNVISDQQLLELVKMAGQEAAKKCIEEFEKQKKKAHKSRIEEQKKKTKGMLTSYRKEKIMLKDQEEFTTEEKGEYRWKFVEDLIGNPHTFMTESEEIINDFEDKRKKAMYSVWMIDNAITQYETDVCSGGSEEDKRRFEILKMKYIDEMSHSVEEIAKMYNVSERQVYRDLGAATDVMRVFLFGI